MGRREIFITRIFFICNPKLTHQNTKIKCILSGERGTIKIIVDKVHEYIDFLKCNEECL